MNDQERIDWDQYYMTLAYLTGMRSSDPNTGFGAVIVDKENVIIATGYNGLPRNMEHPPHDSPIYQRPPEGFKYLYMEHAERNAIYNAGRQGKPLDGAKLYVPALPCMDCARAMVQVGISEVIVHQAGNDAYLQASGGASRWYKDTEGHIHHLFASTGTKLRWWDGYIAVPRAKFGDEVFTPADLASFKLAREQRNAQREFENARKLKE